MEEQKLKVFVVTRKAEVTEVKINACGNMSIEKE